MAEKEVPPELEEVHHKGDHVSKRGEPYYCPECHAEVPFKQACHTCGKEIDWDRVQIEMRR